MLDQKTETSLSRTKDNPASEILGTLPEELCRHLYFTLGHHNEKLDARYHFQALSTRDSRSCDDSLCGPRENDS